MNTQCTQRCGRPPSKHRLSLRYRKQGSFFVGTAAVKADEGQPKDDARSSQRGAKQEKRKNTRTGAHHAENSRKKLPQDLNFLKLHARVVQAWPYFRILKADFTPFRSAAFKALSSSRLTRSRGWLISPDLLHETSLAVPGPQDGPDQPRQHEGGSTKDILVIR